LRHLAVSLVASNSLTCGIEAATGTYGNRYADEQDAY
jgi:hypothetical protein